MDPDRKAAEQGDAFAQYSLGLRYDIGVGVPQDYKQAVAWFRKAAEQGHANAQYYVAIMYANGEGVPQDNKQAAEWHRKAAEQGNSESQYYVGMMYDNGEGVPQDNKQAAEWYRKAAEQGHTFAKFELGVMYAHGEGVPQDHVQAQMWFKLAATPENEKELKNRIVMAAKMTPSQIRIGVPTHRASRMESPDDPDAPIFQAINVFFSHLGRLMDKVLIGHSPGSMGRDCGNWALTEKDLNIINSVIVLVIFFVFYVVFFVAPRWLFNFIFG